MQINRIKYDKNKTCIHLLRHEMRQVHHDYGLMITGMGSNITRVNSFYLCEERYFEFYSVSYCYDGKGHLWMPPNYECDVMPGQCVVMPPNQINRYGGYESVYCEDMITFFGPVADQLFQSGVIGCGLYNAGSARRLLHIGELAADPAYDAQIEANFELQRFLIDIWRDNWAKKQKPDDPIILLQKEIRNNPNRWWTVAEMAEFCHLSDDQFRRRFVDHTGMKPKDYFSQVKMQRACELISGTSATFAEIAEQLGYHDQFHFSRRFKAVIGVSPKQYRSRIQPQFKS